MESVAKARGIYLRALGKDPTDSTGKVAKLRAGSEAIAREAERRRIERDATATRVKFEALSAAHHGRAWYFARNIWYGLPMTGAPEIIYPELPEEAALTAGEWFDWGQRHKRAIEDAGTDHRKSIIPRKPNEPYEAWTARLKRRRRSWAIATAEAVVNRALREQARSYAPSSPAGGRTPKAKRRTRTT
jgi:hypothetical protein